VADHALARSAKGLGGMTYADRAHPTDEAIEMHLAPLVRTPERKRLVEAYAVALEGNALAGAAAALRRCGAPVRVVWGDADSIFSAQSPGYLDRLFPRSRGVRHVPSAKLFFPEERPALIAEEALALWGRP
jgi:pimeloyl-ACP methyl ester carboxylesterase